MSILGRLYRTCVRPWLFDEDPEMAHEKALAMLQALGNMPRTVAALRRFTAPAAPELAQTCFGVHFRNPIGLAAGFDKGAVAVCGLAALGFGFLEVGTTTRHAQPGNPRPRLFRLPEDGALINRMGFNNPGAERTAETLSRLPLLPFPIGGSLGKSKATLAEQAAGDYAYSARLIGPHVQYLVVNVSSPNTPGLRALQAAPALREIVRAVRTTAPTTPLLAKFSPDMTLSELDGALSICADEHLAGVIATNTTVGRAGLARDPKQDGGLSGKPLFLTALAKVEYIHYVMPGLTIVASGGIDSFGTMLAMFKAGASLVQIYTGLVYEGPTLPRSLNLELVRYMRRRRLKHISEIRES